MFATGRARHMPPETARRRLDSATSRRGPPHRDTFRYVSYQATLRKEMDYARPYNGRQALRHSRHDLRRNGPAERSGGAKRRVASSMTPSDRFNIVVREIVGKRLTCDQLGKTEDPTPANKTGAQTSGAREA